MKFATRNSLKLVPTPDQDHYAFLNRLHFWLEHSHTTRFELAMFLGIKKSAITMWFKRGRVPLEHRPQLEKVFASPRRIVPRYACSQWAVRITR